MRSRALGATFFLLAWELLARTGWVSNLIFPSVGETLFAIRHRSGDLAIDTLSTFLRLIIGFTLASPLGIVVGTWFGLSQKLYAFFELIIDFFRSLPVITLFPLIMIVFGLGDMCKVALVMWTVFLLTVINTIYGIRQVPRTRILAARTHGARGWSLVTKVLIPSATPTIIGGLRLSVSLGLVVVIVTEMFTGTTNGLGCRIYDAGLIYEIPTMYAAIVLAGVLGFTLNKLIAFVESRTTHWSGQ